MLSVVNTWTFAVSMGMFAILSLAALFWQVRNLRRRLRDIAGALNAAGDGLEALDAALNTERENVARMENGIQRCWRAVNQRAVKRPSGERGALAQSEAELLDFTGPG